ncbi:MAG: asparagine synthase (glutamine-hydrolyzing) [Planctomycetes bacterium]|nr:asparagine synthase (glutamine-hydrolyzing) [Planctomycetota bacterium]
MRRPSEAELCGFAGIACEDPRGLPARERLAAMARSIAHRGPDDETLEFRAPFGVGFRRLAVIDPEGGRQPHWNEARDIAVWCNGEIYNYRELRGELQGRGHVFRSNSDVECIVHLYEELGERFPERLVGMFAVAVLDWRASARPRLVLARDRIGIKPLYFARAAGTFLFGSEPKALLASGLLPRRLRARALLEYLVQGWIGGPEAAFEGMQRMPPASVLVWEGGEPRLSRYWDLPHESLRGPAAGEEILESLDRSVREQLVSDVPLGAFLSGGMDSSAVADSMARAKVDPLVLCTVGFREEEFDELAIAERTAQRLSARHHTARLEADPALALEELPWFFDEPLADPSCVPTLLVSRMAREHVTVALSGDGGDEVFGGYRRYVFDVAENRARRLLGRAGCRALAGVGRVYPKLDWAPRFLRAKSTLLELGREPARAYYASLTQLAREDALALLEPGLARSLADHDPFDAFEEHYRRPTVDDPLLRATYADFHTFLPDRILVKSDRASMGASLELRPPLLDHRLVERFVHLPAGEKVRGGRGKHALREALRARLPAEILDGPKRGFDIPLRSWIAGPLAGVISEAVESLPQEWFARERLRSALAQHRSGLRDHSQLLWSVFVLERWRLRHALSPTLAD